MIVPRNNFKNQMAMFFKGAKYFDSYGQEWEAFGSEASPSLWRKESGMGVWDSGRGLVLKRTYKP